MSDLFEPLSRPRLMGIVNVTPDSFSDGGRFFDPKTAIEHGLALFAEGADILDIGGESTRPGATRPVVEDELGRVVPVIAELAAAGAVVSVDTMRHEVAQAAMAAGAQIINDVSGGLADPAILRVAAQTGALYVAMHWRAHAATMQQHTSYDEGVVRGVVDELSARIEDALAAGIAAERLVLDPGVGFSKTAEDNWELLGGLAQLQALGYPILVGGSRKSFLGELLAEAGEPRPVDQREAANIALTTWLADRGVWAIRVHDVRASRDGLAVWARLGREQG